MKEFIINNYDIISIICIIWIIIRLLSYILIINMFREDKKTLDNIIKIKKENGTFLDDWGNITDSLAKTFTWFSIYILIFLN